MKLIKQAKKESVEIAFEGLVETKKAYDLAESMFISAIKKEKKVIAAWIYGSFARGDFTPRSDIDFFVLTETPSKLSKLIDEIEKDILSKTGKKAHIELQGNLVREEDKSLIKTVLKEGKLLFSRKNFVWDGHQLGLVPYYIYKYDITSIPASQRNKLTRALYPSKSWYYKKGKKILKEYLGMKDLIKLGKGCVMIPAKDEKILLKVFKTLGVKHNLIRAVWV